MAGKTVIQIDFTQPVSMEDVGSIRAAFNRSRQFTISGTNRFWADHPDLATNQWVTATVPHTLPRSLSLATDGGTYLFREPKVTISADGVITITEGSEVNIFTPNG